MTWLKLTGTGPTRCESLVLFGPGGVLRVQETSRGYTVLQGPEIGTLEVRESAAEIEALLIRASAQKDVIE